MIKVNKFKFTEEMLPITYKWLTNDILKKLTNTPNFTEDDQMKWFLDLKHNDNYKIWSIYFKKTPIGVFGIKNIINKEGEYWGYIGEEKYWGKGIGKWMVNESIIYCKSIGLKKLNLKVLKSNVRAVSLYLQKGFCQISCSNGLIIMEKEI